MIKLGIDSILKSTPLISTKKKSTDKQIKVEEKKLSISKVKGLVEKTSKQMDDLKSKFNLESIQLLNENFERTFLLNQLEANLFKDQQVCRVSHLKQSKKVRETWTFTDRVLKEKEEIDLQ